jgi:peptidoglycan hydrolase CwlO-like protein
MQTQFNTKPKKKINILLLILLLIAVSVFTYWLTDISNDDIESRLNNEIKSLQSKVDSLNKELNDKCKADQPQGTVLPSED